MDKRKERRISLSVGDVFGEWRVLEEAPPKVTARGDSVFYYRVACSCGTIKNIPRTTLTSGRSRSCGCQASQFTSASLTRHGMHASKTYAIWEAMLRRCNSPSDANFHHYGGRGISVCSEWRTFEGFFRDMGEQPPGLTLDRENNAGNYDAANCRWVDMHTQTRNTRRSQMVSFAGEIMCATDAAIRLGIDPSTIWTRSRRFNVSLQEAVDHYATNGKSR